VATAAVIFDFFGTLTPSTPTSVWDDHAARSAAPLGIPARAWRAVLDASFAERATGSLGDLTATFRTLARRVGVDPDEEALAAACAARMTAQRELFELRADAVSTLTALRGRGLRLGVLSDCTVELAETWPHLPLAGLVDARVLSCEEGRRKPNPELQHFLTELHRAERRGGRVWVHENEVSESALRRDVADVARVFHGERADWVCRPRLAR
jgi:putative hydrolase of the HAD superfamily